MALTGKKRFERSSRKRRSIDLPVGQPDELTELLIGGPEIQRRTILVVRRLRNGSTEP
jgi:hypothetical protein